MKVLHFIGSIDRNSGGTAVYLQLLTNELRNLTEVIVVTGSSTNPISLSGINLKYINLNLFRWFQMKNEFRKLLESERPEVVHINGIWDPQNYLFQRVSKNLNIKVVLSPHGMLEPYILKRNPSKKKLALLLYQRYAIKTADILHVTANSELENIRKLGYKKPAMVIPNGLNTSEILEREKLEGDCSYLKMLFLSRIHPKKGIEMLIKAVSRLKDLKFRIIIAGEGDSKYIASLEKLISENGLDRNILFFGGVYGDDKWSLYKQADVFVLPTYSENFGLVVIEALAAGVPVITTKGTPWEELETYKCGWWIELGVSQLANALKEAFYTSRVELRNMGERGRTLVENKYDSRALAKEMLNLYSTVLGY